MDERQAQIKEGAGLEESRVNEELIEFLNKWSFPVLLLIAIVSGGYFFYNQYQVRKIRTKDAAFAQLGNIESSSSPSVFSLTAIADEFDGVGSVAELALLRAAEIHLNAVRSGLDPNDPGVTLSPEDIVFHREQAGTLYQRIADRVAGDADRGLFAINAAFGLAAVAESAGEFDLATTRYADAASLATKHGYPSLATVAAELGSTVGEAREVTLYDAEQLPRMPYEPEPLEATTEVIGDTEAGPAAPDGTAETPDEIPSEAIPADTPAEGDGTEADPGDGTEPDDG